ncbi:hypothetical protein [Thiohalophilus sp.]|uniref:hypothetical protein n=1 Tax=Thiohalophilus sp. TaxID=3028392 RepID=UPI002ACEB2DB|nr:hypothetical protein [Thiohalophilus sp.]MDZ7804954.1 hypothetical protein [Thiohalophilus sp.]
MTRKRKPYKTYTKEFKAEAVKLMEESDRSAAEIALELGVAEISSTNGKNSCRPKVSRPFPASLRGQSPFLSLLSNQNGHSENWGEIIILCV